MSFTSNNQKSVPILQIFTGYAFQPEGNNLFHSYSYAPETHIYLRNAHLISLFMSKKDVIRSWMTTYIQKKKN